MKITDSESTSCSASDWTLWKETQSHASTRDEQLDKHTQHMWCREARLRTTQSVVVNREQTTLYFHTNQTSCVLCIYSFTQHRSHTDTHSPGRWGHWGSSRSVVEANASWGPEHNPTAGHSVQTHKHDINQHNTHIYMSTTQLTDTLCSVCDVNVLKQLCKRSDTHTLCYDTLLMSNAHTTWRTHTTGTSRPIAEPKHNRSRLNNTSCSWHTHCACVSLCVCGVKGQMRRWPEIETTCSESVTGSHVNAPECVCVCVWDVNMRCCWWRERAQFTLKAQIFKFVKSQDDVVCFTHSTL